MAPTETPIDGHVKTSQSAGIAVESAKLQDLPEIVAIHAQTNPESYLTLSRTSLCCLRCTGISYAVAMELDSSQRTNPGR